MTDELQETLELIGSRIKEKGTNSVFIPLMDFPWYHERDGQQMKFHEVGMIVKPQFFDNGAEIRLTRLTTHMSFMS